MFRSEDERHAPLRIEPSSHDDVESLERHSLWRALAGRIVEVVVIDPVVGGKIHAPTSKDEQR
jgi:hypothetical protein